jgi:large subunit ribosomal protein L31
MQGDIHPHYREVVFRDQGADTAFIVRSTIATTREIEWEDGRTLPLHDVDISSASHPFYTGKMKIVDTAGRVERFERRYGRRRAGGEDGETARPVGDEAPGGPAAR